FIGSVKIDALQAYKVELDYSLTGSEGGGVDIISPIASITGNFGKTWKVEYTLTAYYYPPPGQNADIQISLLSDASTGDDKVEIEPLVEEVEIEPLVQPKEKIEIAPLLYHAKGYGVNHEKKSKAGIVHFYYSGSSESRAWDKPVHLVSQEIIYENIESDAPETPMISMKFKNNELVYFTGSLEFPEDKSGKMPMGGSIGIMKDDPKYYPVKPKKITDPNSPYKWEYIINYKNDNPQSLNLGFLGKGEGKSAEISTVRIYSAF
ncbi:MAG: hypothetical protein M3352_12210, partial [Bacteroidota bacterium]|nr:hypothetical protein [Bacteroidota bacterium]